ncbi:unnamed protein product, partial [Ectocarpus sp. 12 AP-2014]
MCHLTAIARMYASSSFVAGHSLWLIPKEPARSNIQKVIDHHSSEQKTANFRAHVTLIAGLEPEGGEAEVIAKAESIALKLGPISARVERTACMGLYFKSVFALLERDPALLDAHKVAKEAFGQDPSAGSDFMPHASLLYGDLPRSTREAIRQEAGVGLVDPGITLEFESIQVWSTKGVVAEWKPLA